MKTLIVFSLTTLGLTFQDTLTIVESARRNGGKSTVNISVMSPVGSLEEVAREASLITRGLVKTVTTKLSNDESIVVTEFEIAAVRVYKAGALLSNKPGEISRIIVQRPGGFLNFDGLELRTVVNEFPDSESSLSAGDEVVVLLSPHQQEPGKFRIAGGAFGVFRVVNENVIALTRRAALRRGDPTRTIATFERDLEAAARR